MRTLLGLALITLAVAPRSSQDSDLKKVGNHGHAVSSLSVSNGARYLVASSAEAVTVWDIAEAERVHLFEGKDVGSGQVPSQYPMAGLFVSESNQLAVGKGWVVEVYKFNGRKWVPNWEVEDIRAQWPLRVVSGAPRRGVLAVGSRHSGAFNIEAPSPSCLELWHLQKGKLPLAAGIKAKIDEAEIEAVALAPDASKVAVITRSYLNDTGRFKTTLQLFDLGGGRKVLSRADDAREIEGMAFSSDGQEFTICGRFQVILDPKGAGAQTAVAIVYDAQGGNEKGRLILREPRGKCVGYLGREKSIVIACQGGTVMAWNDDRSKVVWSFATGLNITAMAPFSSERRLALGCDNGDIYCLKVR